MKYSQITTSMAKDIAFNLGAVLNDEEAGAFADGYNVAMLKVNKDMSTALSNNASLSTNSPVIPDDWVMVPKEPTQAMIKAWLSEVANFRGHAAGYRAALAASPQREIRNYA
ncbi:hypothetical protein CC785_15795 [Salmonella enterica subsp. enterica serovar Berkeley]|uniref:DUF551 domain-containing protein n=1 Tax=Salmonella enterica subsp. enterica serovar Berkeley TaxID=1965103 RepID=A0A636K3P7_SALET|nr:hypothetical protein [Salmonella enterica subsp. enterica serovar Berkeley]EDI0570658.1 hypothetical protein [Salmonella enterica subsp. enterica serovar Berkeley]